MSQIDLRKPHAHRAIHARDSASIAAAQRDGRMATKNFWMELIAAIVNCRENQFTIVTLSVSSSSSFT
jgi:hypothetical protein